MAIKKLKLYILLIFIVSFFSSKVQNSWGSVNIQQIKIPTEDGQWVVADLFKPLSATKNNPAPVVIVIPGFQRSKETLSKPLLNSASSKTFTNCFVKLSLLLLEKITVISLVKSVSSKSFTKFSEELISFC